MTGLERSLESPTISPRPSLASALLLRFGFAYWVLFCVPVGISQIVGFDWLGDLIAPVPNAVVGWVGKAILGISSDLTAVENGSGDKTTDWVWLFCAVNLALIATAVWTAVDRRRAHDDRIRAVLRIVLRYTLALVLVGYGISKVFVEQFPLPSPVQLAQRYGDSSPMGLLWTFMGASPAYVIVSGAAETLGAMLVLFRRTTTLGALLLFTVLTNIVLMNFCYDVPVKINSSHYLAMCLCLIGPDLRRLANVLVWNRPTQAVADAALPLRPAMRIARVVVKTALIGFVLFASVKDSAPRTIEQRWYAGVWNVAVFERDGVVVPPTVTDDDRWSLVRIYRSGGQHKAKWRSMTNKQSGTFIVVVDEQAQTLTLTRSASAAASAAPMTGSVLRYTRGNPDELTVTGELEGARLVLRLERMRPESSLLLSRRFRWISEEPFIR